jgi:hypothetical protein
LRALRGSFGCTIVFRMLIQSGNDIRIVPSDSPSSVLSIDTQM